MNTLTHDQLDAFEREINEIRDEQLAQMGEEDANYIRKMIRIQRALEIGGRVSMVLGFVHPLFWIAGVLLLAMSKILENMEIGHNVLHGQYDWMNDPHINSKTYEWDIVCSAESWKRTHNFEHHTYTNILGKDRDFGYGLFRLTDHIAWRVRNLWQFFTYLLLSLFFEWGVAYHEMGGERVFFGRKKPGRNHPVNKKALRKMFFGKIRRQLLKDYVFFPLLAGPMFLPVLAGNFLANLIRNLWTSTIIFCGHFTEGAQTFNEKDCENETRGQWYYRQLLGSSNLTGPTWFHILSGHLSCQIEHHLFPDIPARRYPAMAKKVEAVARKYGLPYNTGPFHKQYGSVLKRILRYSFPTSGRASSIPVFRSPV